MTSFHRVNSISLQKQSNICRKSLEGTLEVTNYLQLISLSLLKQPNTAKHIWFNFGIKNQIRSFLRTGQGYVL